MDNPIDQIDALLSEGKKYEYANFAYPNNSGGRNAHEYAGEPKSEWLTWITRSKNTVKSYSAKDSAAAALASQSFVVRLQGNGQDEFLRAKEMMMKALQLTREAIYDDRFDELYQEPAKNASRKLTNKVFVVHGHDELLKNEVENFLRSLGLDPIVLHRQPDQGKTLIEKFEHHSDVGYAFILLTPDDIAYSANQEPLLDEKRTKEQRARQNVIFEFGFFVGKLDRSRVCCLYKGSVALPSDLGGLVYKKIEGTFDSQAYAIIKELKAAGYTGLTI